MQILTLDNKVNSMYGSVTSIVFKSMELVALDLRRASKRTQLRCGLASLTGMTWSARLQSRATNSMLLNTVLVSLPYFEFALLSSVKISHFPKSPWKYFLYNLKIQNFREKNRIMETVKHLGNFQCPWKLLK